MSAKKKKSTKPRAKAKPKVSTVEIEKFMLCSEDMDTSIYGQASSAKADGKAITPNAIATIALKYMRTYCESTGLEWRSMTTNTTALKDKTYDVASDQAIKEADRIIKEAKKRKKKVNKNIGDASRARKSVRRKAQPKKK